VSSRFEEKEERGAGDGPASGHQSGNRFVARRGALPDFSPAALAGKTTGVKRATT
jgi:hypothetical protein